LMRNQGEGATEGSTYRAG